MITFTFINLADTFIQRFAIEEYNKRYCQTLSSSAFVSSPLYGPSCSPSLVD